jgi:hypothetical protein
VIVALLNQKCGADNTTLVLHLLVSALAKVSAPA